MHILTLSLIFLTFSFVSPQSIFCLLKCSCENIDPVQDVLQIFGTFTDCCDVSTSGAKGNLVLSGTTFECTLCPSLCDTVCELNAANVSHFSFL